MQKLLRMYARYNQQADQQVVQLLDKLSLEELNQDRKSYYKSLAALVTHITGANLYFQGMFRQALPANSALQGTASLQMPEGDSLDAAGWSAVKDSTVQADQALVDLIEHIEDKDLHAQVAVEWYGGKPATVPVHYLFNIAIIHGVHHRGQISQILDELGMDNDFSGIDVKLLDVMQ